LRYGSGSHMNRLLVSSIALAVIAVLSLVGWLNDFVTLHGARTVYTVECVRGQWRGPLCTGTIVAGSRYRFRAQKVRGEVLFWIAGSTEPSGKLTHCAIENAKNWACRPSADSLRTITYAMQYGHPVVEPASGARLYHSVPKWKWFLLDEGYAYFDEADN
jgi:hypothetical protein